MRLIERRVKSRVPQSIFQYLQKLLYILKDEIQIKHFLLKSFSQYPVYSQLIKECAQSAKYVGIDYHKLEGVHLINFILSQTEPLGAILLKEAQECFRLFASRLIYSTKYKYILETKEFKEIEYYVYQEQIPVRFNALKIISIEDNARISRKNRKNDSEVYSD